jgi:predicted NBD/HSP70 family sugar kinase
MHYVGLDIGGTSLKAGLVDETGHVVESRKAPTATDDLNAFLFNVTELIREFQKSTEVEGVGMGVPGLRSARTHIIETSPNIPCLKYVNLEQLVAEQVQVRCVSENDANAAAYAEFICGAAGCRIVKSQLWPDAGVIGAAMLARDR